MCDLCIYLYELDLDAPFEVLGLQVKKRTVFRSGQAMTTRAWEASGRAPQRLIIQKSRQRCIPGWWFGT